MNDVIMSNFKFVSASGLIPLFHFYPVAYTTGSSCTGLRPICIRLRTICIRLRTVRTGLRPEHHPRPEADTNPAVAVRPRTSPTPITRPEANTNKYASLQHRAFRG